MTDQPIDFATVYDVLTDVITEVGQAHDTLVTFGDLLTIADTVAARLNPEMPGLPTPAPSVEPDEEGEGVYLVEVFGEGGLARGTVFICASFEAARREAERGVTDYYGAPIRWTSGHSGYWEGAYSDGPHERGSVTVTLMEVIA